MSPTIDIYFKNFTLQYNISPVDNYINNDYNKYYIRILSDNNIKDFAAFDKPDSIDATQFELGYSLLVIVVMSDVKNVLALPTVYIPNIASVLDGSYVMIGYPGNVVYNTIALNNASKSQIYNNIVYNQISYGDNPMLVSAPDDNGKYYVNYIYQPQGKNLALYYGDYRSSNLYDPKVNTLLTLDGFNLVINTQLYNLYMKLNNAQAYKNSNNINYPQQPYIDNNIPPSTSIPVTASTDTSSDDPTDSSPSLNNFQPFDNLGGHKLQIGDNNIIGKISTAIKTEAQKLENWLKTVEDSDNNLVPFLPGEDGPHKYQGTQPFDTNYMNRRGKPVYVDDSSTSNNTSSTMLMILVILFVIILVAVTIYIVYRIYKNPYN